MKTELLYHYTSINSALRILASGELHFSNPMNSNDIYERVRQAYGNDDFGKAIRKELALYRPLSFCTDGKSHGCQNVSLSQGHIKAQDIYYNTQ